MGGGVDYWGELEVRREVGWGRSCVLDAFEWWVCIYGYGRARRRRDIQKIVGVGEVTSLIGC